MLLSLLLATTASKIFNVLMYILIILAVLVCLYLVLSAVFTLPMYLYNKLTQNETQTPQPESELTIGVITQRVTPLNIGQVQIESQTGMSLRPARLYVGNDEDFVPRNLEVGTEIVVIDIDDDGIAYVEENKFRSVSHA